MFRKFKADDITVMISKKMLHRYLSPEALGCLVYISGTHKEDERIRIDELLRAFNMGRGKWNRISRELREAKIIKLEKSQGGSRLSCIDY